MYAPKLEPCKSFGSVPAAPIHQIASACLSVWLAVRMHGYTDTQPFRASNVVVLLKSMSSYIKYIGTVSVCQFMYLSIHLFVCLSICLSIYLSIYLSGYIYVASLVCLRALIRMSALLHVSTKIEFNMHAYYVFRRQPVD